MALLKFLKGNYSNLSNAAINEGQILVCGDTGELFVDVAADKRVKIGDFITIANLTALEALDATKVPTSRLYYVEDGNILARSDGEKWVQVNRQKTKDEMIEFLGLGSLAYKSEVAEADLNTDLAAKINSASGAQHSHANKDLLDTYTQTEADLADAVAKKHAHANADELAKIADGDKAKWDAVVADHLTSADKTTLEDAIKEAKKAGTDANTNIEAYKVTNDARVLAVEEDVAEITNAENGILAQAKAYADGKDAAIEAAQKAGDDAQDTIDAYIESNNTALAGVKATAEAAATKTYTDEELAKKVDKVEGKSLVDDAEITKLAGVSAGANKVEKSDVNGNIKVDGAEVVVYTHPASHTVSEISDFDASIKAYDYATKTELGDVDAKFADYVTSESYGVDKKATEDALADRYTKTEADGKFAIKGEDAYDDTELAGRVKAIEDDYLVEADKTELSGLITAEKERAEGIEGGLRTDVDAIKGDYLKGEDKTALEGKITAEENRAKGVEESLQTQINTIMNNPDTEGVINSIEEFTNYINTHGEIAEGFRTDIDKNKEDIAANAKAIADQATADEAKYETKTDASAKLAEAKEYADGINTALDARLDTLEAIDHEAYKAADAELATAIEAAKTEAANQDTVVLAEAQAYADQAEADAIAAAEGKVNALAGNVYTKEEVYTKSEVENLLTWGSF